MTHINIPAEKHTQCQDNTKSEILFVVPVIRHLSLLASILSPFHSTSTLISSVHALNVLCFLSRLYEGTFIQILQVEKSFGFVFSVTKATHYSQSARDVQKS